MHNEPSEFPSSEHSAPEESFMLQKCLFYDPDYPELGSWWGLVLGVGGLSPEKTDPDRAREDEVSLGISDPCTRRTPGSDSRCRRGCRCWDRERWRCSPKGDWTTTDWRHSSSRALGKMLPRRSWLFDRKRLNHKMINDFSLREGFRSTFQSNIGLSGEWSYFLFNWVHRKPPPVRSFSITDE